MIAVVTGSIPKGYAKIQPPFYISKNEDEVHYWAVSDSKINQPPWKNRVVARDIALTSRMCLLQHKILLHKLFPDYDYTIWIDAPFRLKVDPGVLVNLLRETGDTMAFVKHPWLQCMYEEAAICVTRGRASSQKVEKQITRYREEGYPEKNGLAATTVFVRDNKDPKTCELFELWAHELMNESRRAQVSFDYCIWKLGMSYRLLNIPWANNAYYGAGSPVEAPGLTSLEEQGLVSAYAQQTASEFGSDISIINVGFLHEASCSRLRVGAPKANLYGVPVSGYSITRADLDYLNITVLQEEEKFSKPVHLVFVDGRLGYDSIVSNIHNWILPNVIIGGYVIVNNGYYRERDAFYKASKGIRRALADTFIGYHNWRQVDRVKSTMVFQRLT